MPKLALITTVVIFSACAHSHLGLLLPPPERDKKDLIQCQTDYQTGITICFYANGDCAEAVGVKRGDKEWTSIREGCMQEGDQTL